MSRRFAGAGEARLLLGAEHPLAMALSDVAGARRQLVAVAAIGGAALLASAAGSAVGTAVMLAAGCVAIVLAVRLLVALDRARDRALDAIIAGEDHLPVALVRRQRERLLRPGVREELAGMYEDLARRAEPSHEPAVGRPGLRTTQRCALAHDLRGVARLIRGAALDAPRVARAEQLLENRTSPLYGADVEALRDALCRIGPTGGKRREAHRHR